MDDTHPVIAQFQAHAEVMDSTDRRPGLDDAIVKLAGWMFEAGSRLTEDDLTVLTEIGAILYRDGLNRRMGGQDAKKPL